MSISSGCYNLNFVPVTFIVSPHSQYDLLPSVSGVRFMDFSRTSTVVSTSSVSLFASHSSSNKNRRIRLSGVRSDLGEVKSGDCSDIWTCRSLNKSDDHIPVPPLVRSAALWGVFLAVSSNTRYQVVNGLEQLVEASPLAKRVLPVAMAFRVGVRFANNIYGGMQFVDWAN